MKEHCISRIALRAALAIVCAMGMSLLSSAQTSKPSGSRAPRYDAATEITVKGSVEAVKQWTGTQGWNGTHLRLKTDKETLDVHVGPSWFLAKNDISFANGDQIEVTGSKVKFGNADALLAREITKGTTKLVLRNEKGFPLWSRGRRP